jgi:RNA ligase (TIGR02306 family)
VFDDDYSLFIGKDVADALGVTKYEPPEPVTNQGGLPRTSKKQTNPNFHKYTDIENWKWYPDLFKPDEYVYVTEKIHGTNFRAGWVPYHAGTWWKRLKQLLHIAPKYEFVYGSHNVQFQDRKRDHGFYGPSLGRNVYAEAVEKYDLRNKLQPNEVVYAEIYGDGIQKGYLYGCQPGERKMVVIDLKLGGEYVSHRTTTLFCGSRGLPMVPLDAFVYYDTTRILKYVEAPSWLGKEIREGVVIKPVVEEHTYMGRKILKWKSDKFLLTQEDDSH